MAFADPLHYVLLPGIISLGVVSLGAILRAHNNLVKEAEELKACKMLATKISEYIQKKKENDTGEHPAPENGIAAQDGYAVIKSYIRDNVRELVSPNELSCGIDSSEKAQLLLNTCYTGKERTLRTSYVSDRLYAILASVSEENMVRISPPLEDLHELTQQREEAGICVSIFSAVIPSVLVMGICGTLFGVHELLPTLNGDGSIRLLAQTLEPGVWAVATTIILLLVRGLLYNRRRSAFISELDDFTIKTLLPFFKPLDILEADTRKSMHHIRHVVQNVLELDKTQTQFESYKQQLDAWAFKSSELFTAGSIPDLYELLTGIQQAQNTLNTRRQEALSNLQHMLNETIRFHASRAQRAERLNTLKTALQKLVSLETELLQLASDAADDIKKLTPAIDTLAGNLHESGISPQLLTELENYKKSVSALEAWCNNVQTNEIQSDADSALDCMKNEKVNLDYYFSEQNLNRLEELRQTAGMASNHKEQLYGLKEQVRISVILPAKQTLHHLETSLTEHRKSILTDGRLYTWSWVSVLLILQDSVKHARAILYNTRPGRIVMGAMLLLYIVWVVAPAVNRFCDAAPVKPAPLRHLLPAEAPPLSPRSPKV